MIAYTVTCTFQNESLAREWIQWLRREHLADVIEAGAIDAEVVKLDGNPVRCEVRYHFGTREDFNNYEREHAARLRKAGLEKFPLDRGLSYVRSVGEVVAEYAVKKAETETASETAVPAPEVEASPAPPPVPPAEQPKTATKTAAPRKKVGEKTKKKSSKKTASKKKKTSSKKKSAQKKTAKKKSSSR